MAEQQHIVRVDVLEEAIETLVHDRRVPKRLRTALAVYQNERNGLVYRGFGLLSTASSGTSKSAGVFADDRPRENSRKSSDRDCRVPGCVPNSIEQQIKIQMWLNDESQDWSVEINGQCHEHVTSEVMEALVECAVLIAEASIMRVLVVLPQ
jgi:hypothetical protein